MDIFSINKDTCNQCGACAAVCHLGLIDFQKKSYPDLPPRVIPLLTSLP